MNKLEIIYENENIYIINKPQGLATQGGKGVTHSVDTVLAQQVGKKIFLVHRLDKDTEGLLIVAKDSKSATLWTDLIGGKEITKTYNALCVGTLKEKKGTISEPITHKGVTKNAITFFEVENETTKSIEFQEKQENISLSLIKLQLSTGRMHQIRIHLAKNGVPIAGDDKYGDFKSNKKLRKLGIKKLQLTAVKLEIPKKYLIENSTSNEKIVFSIEKSVKI